MLVLRTSRQLLSKFYTGIGKNYSCSVETQKLLSVISNKTHATHTSCGNYRFFMHSSALHIEQPSNTDQPPKIGELTEYHAYDMIHKLSDNDRKSLSRALSRYDSEKTKSKFQGEIIRN